MEPEERKKYTMMQQVNTLRVDKHHKARAAQKVRTAAYQLKKARLEVGQIPTIVVPHPTTVH
jgi:hypothetical protein